MEIKKLELLGGLPPERQRAAATPAVGSPPACGAAPPGGASSLQQSRAGRALTSVAAAAEREGRDAPV